jgi:sirohydrochlorin cobaltochelatase
MTDAVVARAERIAEDSTVGPETGLAVIGHGTERNPKSAKATRDHAARIRDRGRFAASEALFMDQEPFVESVLERFGTQSIVAVPLFIADGFHTREEIPELLGLAGEYPDYENPSIVEGREVRYAGAVGTDPSFAGVIAERAREAFAGPPTVDNRPSESGSRSPDRDENGSDTETSEAESEAAAAREAFLGRIEGGIDADGASSWGELLINPEEKEAKADGARTYELRHAADEHVDAATLDRHTDPDDAEEIARFDDEGKYRPLKSAPTLARGWRLVGLDSRDLYRAVSGFYPASIANWYREQRGTLDITHYAETAARQTGMYDPVDELEGKALDRAVEACCTDDVCLKRRVWESGETGEGGEGSEEASGEGREIDAPPGDGEFPCREPCSLFVAAVREFALAEREGNDETQNGGDSEHTALTETDREDLDAILAGLGEREGVESVRPGEVSDPRNHYRARYLRAKLRDLDEGGKNGDRATAEAAPNSRGGNR